MDESSKRRLGCCCWIRRHRTVLHMDRVLFGKLFPILLIGLNVICVLFDFGVRVAIVGRVGERIVAETLEHRSDCVHLCENVWWYLSHPGTQRFQVDRFDDLVRWAFHFGERDFVSNELFVVQHSIVPGDVQKGENVFHGRFRMQHQLFVVDWQTGFGADVNALGVHVLDDVVPAREAVFVAVQIEACVGEWNRGFSENNFFETFLYLKFFATIEFFFTSETIVMVFEKKIIFFLVSYFVTFFRLWKKKN